MTKADRLTQAQAMLDRAILKRKTAQKLIAEAEEELIEVQIIFEDIAKEGVSRKGDGER